MNAEIKAKSVINKIHGKLVTEAGSLEAIREGLEEYAEYERAKLEAEIIKNPTKSRLYHNAYKTGLRNIQKKVRATANACEALGYNASETISEFRKLLGYSR